MFCFTDQIAHNTTLNFPLCYPYIALINKSTVLLTKDTRKKLLIADLNNGEVLTDFILDESQSKDLIPVCLNENLVAFTEKSNGTTHLYDWRSNEKNEKIHGLTLFVIIIIFLDNVKPHTSHFSF